MRFGMQAKFILFAVPCIAIFAGVLSFVTIQREEDLLLRNATQQGMGIARISAVLFTNARIYEGPRATASPLCPQREWWLPAVLDTTVG